VPGTYGSRDESASWPSGSSPTGDAPLEFPTYVRRRLIFERRIAYFKIGRHVRIDERDLDAFIDQGRSCRSVARASWARGMTVT
jgi:excisionase family DNA binding protein